MAVEDRFAYLSDEDSDTLDDNDEDWSPSKERHQTLSRQPLSKISFFYFLRRIAALQPKEKN